MALWHCEFISYQSLYLNLTMIGIMLYQMCTAKMVVGLGILQSSTSQLRDLTTG